MEFKLSRAYVKLMTSTIAKLVTSMLAGEEKSSAHLISLAKNDSPVPPEIIDKHRKSY